MFPALVAITWKYLIEDVEFKNQLSVEKPIVRGYNFSKFGKVLGL